MHLPTAGPDVLAARPAAVVMVACAVVHTSCAVRNWTPAPSLLTIAVALLCLHCVRHLWIAPRIADWVWVTLGSAAMLVLHLVMLAGPTAAQHGHGATATGRGAPFDVLAAPGLALPLIGLALAWWALGAHRLDPPDAGSGRRSPSEP